MVTFVIQFGDFADLPTFQVRNRIDILTRHGSFYDIQYIVLIAILIWHVI